MRAKSLGCRRDGFASETIMIGLSVALSEWLGRMPRVLPTIFVLLSAVFVVAGCGMNRPISIHPVCDGENALKEYSSLLETMTISKYQNEVAEMVEFIVHNKARYQGVEDEVHVSRVIVAAIHAREASLSFEANLLNGEPLDRRTEKVPKGRGPWPTWESAAIEAMGDLTRMGITSDVLHPSPAKMACILEHRRPPILSSSYVWSPGATVSDSLAKCLA